MAVTTLSPWFGSNRMLADRVGEKLNGLGWVGIPFAGGMCEISRIKARTIVANDKHLHIINLAEVVRTKPEELKSRLEGLIFHPNILKQYQQLCINVEQTDEQHYDDVEWAMAFFVCSWMSRSATAGTKDEFKAGIATRWNAAGGDSNVRFRSAIEAIDFWAKEFRRCTFDTQDFTGFLKKCHDNSKHGIYCDPPFPGTGNKYKHVMTWDEHVELEAALHRMAFCKIVCRFYDTEEIRNLYCVTRGWQWEVIEGGRKQTNEKAPEVLITKNFKEAG